jgi:hypothetical protein
LKRLILSAFLRSHEGFIATRNDPPHHRRVCPVRGGHLRSIEHPESSGRSSADVDQPAPRSKRGLCEPQRFGDGFTLCADSFGDLPVLRIDEIDNAQRVQRIDLLRGRVLLFGEATIAHECL